MNQEHLYIWQNPAWPEFRWDSDAILKSLGELRFHQGALFTRMKDLGFDIRLQAQAEILIEEALKTSEIEGEILGPKSVRSSVAKRLGLPDAGLMVSRNEKADGLVDILLDATMNYSRELSPEILYGWHAALFPTGYSGFHKLLIGAFRNDADGPMQIVSGPIGREKVHYEAPGAGQIHHEIRAFLSWWQTSFNKMDGIIRSAVAHLWFVAIHPFEDGNGRLARTLTDMALAQDENLSTRFYSLSAQIMSERDDYYRLLEITNKGDGDITEWLLWYTQCMTRALLRSELLLKNILQKARFWKRHAQTELNQRQMKVVNLILEKGPGGFEGGMKNQKYAGIAHTSRATAQRELADLVKKEVFVKNPGGGRSVSYDIRWDE